MSENPENKTNGGERFQKLINSGAEFVGSMFPGVLSGSAEAVLYGSGGTIVSIILKHLGKEFSRRFMGPREEARVGALIMLASEEIQRRRENGDRLREDGFFDEEATGRKNAEEVIESVLLKCQRDPEEKKIEYMAKLLSNICFDSGIGVHTAHQIVKAAEQLTYRQLCILKVCAIKDSLALRGRDYREQERFSKNLRPILYECYDLYLRGYVSFGGDVAFGPTDVKPAEMNVQGLGADIFNLMELMSIPQKELESTIRQLK